MCGRFSLGTISEAVQKLVIPQSGFQFAPRYNISPGQQILAIKSTDGNLIATTLHWGLIPSWAKEKAIGYKMINARSETVAEKPSFRSAYKSRRCLIPADGFYEWKRSDSGKQPYYIHRKDAEQFSFAGIWETWSDKNSGEEIASCSIITTSANSLLKPIHHRMPVVIETANSEEWLLSPSSHLLRLLEPRDWPAFESYPVSTFVNNARNEGAECASPLT